jgi:hypothetical protein
MSGLGTVAMGRVYSQMSPIAGFFASLFITTRDTIFNAAEIEFDIERDEEDVAVVLLDCDTGVVLNSFDKSTNKKYKPPKLGEGYRITADELYDRMPGDTPFQDPEFQKNAIKLALKNSAKIEAKIMRHMNLQGSQIMQTGALTLPKKGGGFFSLSYSPKTTHFPTSSVGWGQTGDDIYGDLESLASVIRTDGKMNPDTFIMGSSAFRKFMQDDDMKALFDNRRMEVGGIGRTRQLGGGQYRGTVDIGPYTFDIWTCDERYKDPVSGDTVYMDPDKVICMVMDARRDACFGGVAFIAPTEQRAQNFLPLPQRLERLGKGGIALYPNAFLADNNRSVQGELHARPLLVPNAIDTFGCLDTQP